MRKFLYLGPVTAVAMLALPSMANAARMEVTGLTPDAGSILSINGPSVFNGGGTVGVGIGTIVGGEVYSASVGGVAAIPANTTPPINTIGNFLAAGPDSGTKATLTFTTPVHNFNFLL